MGFAVDFDFFRPCQMNHPGLRNYETVYGVGLLDDLHNYFPALLYDHSRFHNLTTVFHYIRAQMNNRFNLYRYGATLAGAGSSPLPMHTPMTTPIHVPQPPPVPAPTNIREVDPLSSVASAQMLLSVLQLASGLGPELDDIAGVGGVVGPDVQTRRVPSLRRTAWGLDRLGASALSPVIVRPSEEVIARATEEVQGSDLPAGTICAVCQDSIQPSDTARRLRPCTHVYHRGCIDQWFQRSVLCPSCRHDIRE